MAMSMKWIVCFIVLLVLLYGCFLVPYTLQKNFNLQNDFAIASTISAIVMSCLAVCGNMLICYVLSFGYNMQRSLNYLIILMAMSDGVLPLFYYPINLAVYWVGNHDLWFVIDLSKFYEAIKYLRCFEFGAATLSIMSVLMISILQFYQVQKRQDHVPKGVKVMSTLVTLALSTVTSAFLFNYFDEEWSHAFNASVTFYIPITLIFIIMLVTYFITERSTTFEEGNADRQQFLYSLYLCYLVLWMPWYSVDVIHKYCCRMDYHHFEKARFYTANLVQLKCCLNVFLLAYFDKRFKYTVTSIFKNICPCTESSPESIQFKDNRDFSIRYSANQNDINLDFDDDRALIS